MNFYNFLEELHDKYELVNNPNHYLDDPTRDEITDFDHLCDELRCNGFFDTEVHYYYKAMKFLSEKDNSLRESLEIAEDMGFELKDINSELLASLLASEFFRFEFYRLEEEINEFLNK